jgi:hypothetical protein
MENSMSHQTWELERSEQHGVRYTVKLWPTGPHKRAGMRYRMLRGEWHKSGIEGRDAYLSKIGLQKRVAELEAAFLTANTMFSVSVCATR